MSNLPCVSKLLERVVAAQLVELLAEHNFLYRFQSAYRPGNSTETAVLRVLSDILCDADGGDLVLLVLLDLSAAFDTIDHSILLQRLHNEFGVIGSANQWFQSYLADRSQHVTVHLSSSETTQLTCGVPQGFVLGPVLFLIYTAQLGKIIEGYGVGHQLFADDNGLYDSFHPDHSFRTAISAEA